MQSGSLPAHTIESLTGALDLFISRFFQE